MKNVGEAASARQKQPKKRSLRVVNEHFEAVFNAAMATQVVFQQPDRVDVAFYVHHKPVRWMDKPSSTLRRKPL
jgi:hypothetical protein